MTDDDDTVDVWSKTLNEWVEVPRDDLLTPDDNGGADADQFPVPQSDLSYWIAALANTLDCDECDICENGTHSLENVEREMRGYIGITGAEAESETHD